MRSSPQDATSWPSGENLPERGETTLYPSHQVSAPNPVTGTDDFILVLCCSSRSYGSLASSVNAPESVFQPLYFLVSGCGDITSKICTDQVPFHAYLTATQFLRCLPLTLMIM